MIGWREPLAVSVEDAVWSAEPWESEEDSRGSSMEEKSLFESSLRTKAGS